MAKLSDFDEGPWILCPYDDRRVESCDFYHDVQLEVSGDFETPEQLKAYMNALFDKLNGETE